LITLFNIRPRALNVGNDIIAIGLRNYIREAFGEVVNIVTLPATSKYEAGKKAGLDAATVYEINQYGHGVIIGGGNLYENGELQLDLNALEALEAPLMLFSLSMGRIYGRLNRLVRRTNAMPDDRVLKLGRKALVNLARCQATYDYLAGIGLENAELGGCPTLHLDDVSSHLPQVPASNRDMVMLSVRNPMLMSIPTEIRANVSAHIAGIVESLRDMGYGTPKLLCHDYRDIEFAASFKGLDYLYIEDPQMFLATLKAARLNVTYRLHSALPCLSFGTLCVKISYDERALSLMETIGYGGWNIDMVKTPDVVAAVRDRLGRLDELKHLKRESQETWDRLRDVNRQAFGRFAKTVKAYRDEGLGG
jgi:hypothetical protein